MMSKGTTVSFTSLKMGTIEDFKIIAANDKETARGLPEQLIEHLHEMAKDDGAYKISRLDHVLQCATRAYRDNADDEWVTAALLHDIGDALAPFTHDKVAGEIIRPFVREEVCWVVSKHGTFQMFYNRNLADELRYSREKYVDHPFYQSAIDFCEKWDQCSFDPDYETEELEFFVPLVKRIFSKTPFSQV